MGSHSCIDISCRMCVNNNCKSNVGSHLCIHVDIIYRMCSESFRLVFRYHIGCAVMASCFILSHSDWLEQGQVVLRSSRPRRPALMGESWCRGLPLSVPSPATWSCGTRRKTFTRGCRLRRQTSLFLVSQVPVSLEIPSFLMESVGSGPTHAAKMPRSTRLNTWRSLLLVTCDYNQMCNSGLIQGSSYVCFLLLKPQGKCSKTKFLTFFCRM